MHNLETRNNPTTAKTFILDTIWDCGSNGWNFCYNSTAAFDAAENFLGF